MPDMQTHSDVAVAAVKAAPPAIVAALEFAGISLNDWVLIATLIYVMLQSVVLFRDKIWRPWRSRKQ